MISLSRRAADERHTGEEHTEAGTCEEEEEEEARKGSSVLASS